MAAPKNARDEAAVLIAMMRARTGLRILRDVAEGECVAARTTNNEERQAAAVSTILTLVWNVSAAAHEARELGGDRNKYANLADIAAERAAKITADSLGILESVVSLPSIVHFVERWAKENMPVPSSTTTSSPPPLVSIHEPPAMAMRYSIAAQRSEKAKMSRSRRIQANNGVDARTLPVPSRPRHPRPRAKRSYAAAFSSDAKLSDSSRSQKLGRVSCLPNAQPFVAYSSDSCILE